MNPNIEHKSNLTERLSPEQKKLLTAALAAVKGMGLESLTLREIDEILGSKQEDSVVESEVSPEDSKETENQWFFELRDLFRQLDTKTTQMPNGKRQELFMGWLANAKYRLENNTEILTIITELETLLADAPNNLLSKTTRTWPDLGNNETFGYKEIDPSSPPTINAFSEWMKNAMQERKILHTDPVYRRNRDFKKLPKDEQEKTLSSLNNQFQALFNNIDEWLQQSGHRDVFAILNDAEKSAQKNNKTTLGNRIQEFQRNLGLVYKKITLQELSNHLNKKFGKTK